MWEYMVDSIQADALCVVEVGLPKDAGAPTTDDDALKTFVRHHSSFAALVETTYRDASKDSIFGLIRTSMSQRAVTLAVNGLEHLVKSLIRSVLRNAVQVSPTKVECLGSGRLEAERPLVWRALQGGLLRDSEYAKKEELIRFVVKASFPSKYAVTLGDRIASSIRTLAPDQLNAAWRKVNVELKQKGDDSFFSSFPPSDDCFLIRVGRSESTATGRATLDKHWVKIPDMAKTLPKLVRYVYGMRCIFSHGESDQTVKHTLNDLVFEGGEFQNRDGSAADERVTGELNDKVRKMTKSVQTRYFVVKKHCARTVVSMCTFIARRFDSCAGSVLRRLVGSSDDADGVWNPELTCRIPSGHLQ